MILIVFVGIYPFPIFIEPPPVHLFDCPSPLLDFFETPRMIDALPTFREQIIGAKNLRLLFILIVKAFNDYIVQYVLEIRLSFFSLTTLYV